jgi:hypothetical protein
LATACSTLQNKKLMTQGQDFSLQSRARAQTVSKGESKRRQMASMEKMEKMEDYRSPPLNSTNSIGIKFLIETGVQSTVWSPNVTTLTAWGAQVPDNTFGIGP